MWLGGRLPARLPSPSSRLPCCPLPRTGPLGLPHTTTRNPSPPATPQHQSWRHTTPHHNPASRPLNPLQPRPPSPLTTWWWWSTRGASRRRASTRTQTCPRSWCGGGVGGRVGGVSWGAGGSLCRRAVAPPAEPAGMAAWHACCAHACSRCAHVVFMLCSCCGRAVPAAQSTWISKASERQRRGRAGRCQVGAPARRRARTAHAAYSPPPPPHRLP